MIGSSFGRPIWTRRRPKTRGWDPAFGTPTSDVVHGLVTVIIPVHNGSEFLERAVASVQAQTFQDFEIVIVDGGSTDDSLQIAQRLASNDSRIKVHAIDSDVLVRSRNHAIRRSRGEFIAFLDQHDWWLPEKLKRQVARFDHDDSAVVYSDAIHQDHLSPHGGSLTTELPVYRDRFSDVRGRLPEGQVQRHLITGNFADQGTVMIRTDWVRKVGRMDEAVGVDCYEYLLRIALAGGSFGAIRQPLVVHDRGRLNGDQNADAALLLWLFKDAARRFPQYRELWTSRIREYQTVLIAAGIYRIRDGSRPLRRRLTSLYVLLWLHPRGSQVITETTSLLSAAWRRLVRAVTRRIGRKMATLNDRATSSIPGRVD